MPTPPLARADIALLEAGKDAETVLEALLEEDPDRELRQVGIVDRNGHAATFTGSECYDWAGGRTGTGYAVQGNILVGKETVDALGQTFESSTGPLSERLLAALGAAQKAGGDKRGKQSAALLVVKEKGGYGGYNDRAIDLRVDDHPEPIKELNRIFQLHQLYFSKPAPEDIIEITEKVKKDLIVQLLRLGYLDSSDATVDEAYEEALTAFYLSENFEERMQPRGKIDKAIVNYMRQMEAGSEA